MPVVIKASIQQGPPRRHCGECTLCCRLLPMRGEDNDRVEHIVNEMIARGMAGPHEFDGMREDWEKPAGVKCKFQRHMKGCSIYRERPFGCRMWSCRWLVDPDGHDLRRPDRCHYVVDLMPDMVRQVHDDGSPPVDVPVIQVWVDPKHPDAHRDPALRGFLERRGREGYVAIIRYSSYDGFILVPPCLSDTGDWIERRERTAIAKRRGHDLNPDNWEFEPPPR